MQKRLVVPAAKRAAVLLWGEDGLNEIAQALPDDTREEFFRVHQADEWVACRHFIAWMYAAHHGPAKLSLPKIREYINRTFDFGYGIVRKSMLRMADPAVLTPRVGGMWHDDQTAGELVSTLDAGGKSATFRLTDNPYTETPQTRAGVAENYRYAYSLTRAKDVTETHALEKPGVLVFRIRWT
jgi:hypothetical protein